MPDTEVLLMVAGIIVLCLWVILIFLMTGNDDGNYPGSK